MDTDSKLNNRTVKFVNHGNKSQLTDVTLIDCRTSDDKSSIPNLSIWNIFFMRHRQTFAQALIIFLAWSLQGLNIVCILVPLFWPFYFSYIFLISRDTAHENGSRPISWWRNSPLWKWFAEYFPSRLIKEVDLDPDRKYIFGYHPHGIVSLGVITNFGTNATGVEQLFPGINIRPLTLDGFFKVPFFRELILSSRAASASKTSIRNILSKGPGSACLIVVGGTEETLEAKPDRANLKLAERCGFVKMALENGADLVPVFGFGENQLYDQIENDPGSWLHSIQHKIKRYTSIPTPLWHGRGLFNNFFGALPYRLPLTVITGAPIKVKQTTNPTDQQIQDLHQRYKEALTDLYERNKGAYWVGSDPPELNYY